MGLSVQTLKAIMDAGGLPVAVSVTVVSGAYAFLRHLVNSGPFILASVIAVLHPNKERRDDAYRLAELLRANPKPARRWRPWRRKPRS